jgi:hypothetical protein
MNSFLKKLNGLVVRQLPLCVRFLKSRRFPTRPFVSDRSFARPMAVCFRACFS